MRGMMNYNVITNVMYQIMIINDDNNVIINDNDNYKRYARSLIRFKRS